MEQLEKTLKEIPVEKSDREENEFYEGLNLIEDKLYGTGTSIKYWM